jgi:ketosteroid isomerase-like protein
MKKIFLCCLFVHFVHQSSAQNAQALVSAEKAFEKACLEKGIRDGFLTYVDSNAIQFNEKGPIDAKKFWLSIPPFEGVFTWSPTIAEISASGDWGYTSGNFEHRPKSRDDIPNQFGQYTTVWQRYPDGQWKYLIDIGNPHAQAPLDKASIVIPTRSISDLNISETSLMDLEKKFILDLNKDLQEAYVKFCSDNYHLNFSGHDMVAQIDSAIMLFRNYKEHLEYLPAGVKLSPGKEMAAIYGTFKSGEKTSTYLRIWRHEIHGWKIALEVVRI